jgi:hypothetical protein
VGFVVVVGEDVATLDDDDEDDEEDELDDDDPFEILVKPITF